MQGSWLPQYGAGAGGVLEYGGSAITRHSQQEILPGSGHDALHPLPLFFLEAWFGFEVEAVHLPGRENMHADDLSRNHRSAFLSKALSPDPAPTLLPWQLPELLLDAEGWTSPRWTMLFYAIATAG